MKADRALAKTVVVLAAAALFLLVILGLTPIPRVNAVEQSALAGVLLAGGVLL